MIQKILQWIREAFQKMIGQTSIKQVLHVDVTMSQPMVLALDLWCKMYENKAPWLSDEVVSLNLPSAISSEIARSATIEMKMKIDGSSRAEFLQQQMDVYIPKMRQYVEYGVAKGGLIMKPYIVGKTIAVDFVQADQFYPIAFNARGDIISCVFADQRMQHGKYFTRLEYHDMKDHSCVIKNLAYKSDSPTTLGTQVPLSSIQDWEDLAESATIQDIEKPLFAYFKYPLANNIDVTSPLGVSCYSRAVTLIEEADRQWSDLLWEFESGRRALYVDVLAFKKDSNGRPMLPNRRLYRTLETGSAEGEMYHEWTPSFREASILSGLDAILKKIEFACGLAYGTISDPNTEDKTATEIKISKQRTAATITDTQKTLQNALDQLLYAMDVWATLGKLSTSGKFEATYTFDDSIVTDYEMQFTQDSKAINMQVMSKVEFRMRNYGESEEVAKKKLKDVAAEQEMAIEQDDLMPKQMQKPPQKGQPKPPFGK